jgi:hypothetical protein
VWPKGYQPLDSVLCDKAKLDAITEVQRRIGVAKKNYMKMAKKTNFSLDKHTIVRYLEGKMTIFINQSMLQDLRYHKNIIGNLWQVDNVTERIIETIEWRVSFGLPTLSHSLVRYVLDVYVLLSWLGI